MPNARRLFEALVREHAEMLTVFLKSVLHNPSDVDDLFQEDDGGGLAAPGRL